MKLKIFIIISLFILTGCENQKIPYYKRPGKPIEKRVKDLLSRMTLEEKADMLAGKDFWRFKGIDRLGVPSIHVTDCGHGVTVINNESGEGKGCA